MSPSPRRSRHQKPPNGKRPNATSHPSPPHHEIRRPISPPPKPFHHKKDSSSSLRPTIAREIIATAPASPSTVGLLSSFGLRPHQEPHSRNLPADSVKNRASNMSKFVSILKPLFMPTDNEPYPYRFHVKSTEYKRSISQAPCKRDHR